MKHQPSMFVLVLLSLLSLTNAANYYVSSFGADTNAGTSMQTSWRSMQRVYQAMTATIRSGDSIFFCINERWTYSMIDASVAGVSYGAYDCVNQRSVDQVPIDQRPVITPSIDLETSRWSIAPINQSLNQTVPTLQYDFSNDPMIQANGLAAVWVNGIRYHLARFPNLVDPVNQVTWGQAGEFVQMINATSTTLFWRVNNQPSYQKAANFWSGTRMHFRISNWIYFESFIAGSNVLEESSTSTMNRLTIDRDWNGLSNFYFYLEAHPSGRYPLQRQLLDQVGEFVLDQATNKLYLIPLDLNTANRILSGSLVVNALYGNGGSAALIRRTNINVTNLEFTMSNGGMIVQQSGNLNIRFCSFTHTLGTAYLQQTAHSNIRFTDNYVDDSEATCVTGNGATVVIARNSINRCGLYARTATTNQNPAWNGVTITSGIVRDNKIKGTGYAAVAPHAGATVDSNYIENAMMTLNDGAAVYSYGSYDNFAKVYNNVIVNVVGNFVSWFPNRIAPCLYMDEGTYGALLQNNTCVGAAQCVYLNKAFSHSILMNNCQCPGLYTNQGNGHLFAGNLVVSTGTNGQWQNPMVRLTSTAANNYNGIATFFDQAYCIKGSGYMFQRQTSAGTWRFDFFDDWKNAEIGNNPLWERGSRGVTNCDGWKPIDYTAADPWAFLESSSSSTGSSVVVRSSSSSAVPVISSSARPPVVASSTGSDSSPVPVPETCSFSGPFTQPSTRITLTVRFASFVASSLALLQKDLDRWFELRGHVDLAWRVNMQCGSFQPVNPPNRRRLLAADIYELVFYIVDYEMAREASNEMVLALNGTGWYGELSSSRAIPPASVDLVVVLQCENGSTVPLPEACPVSSGEETSGSATSGAAIGGAVGGVIGAIVVLSVVALGFRAYRKRSMHTTTVSPRASPTSSPVFNVLKGSPASSPRLDAGVTLERLSSASTQQNDQSGLTPRFELSTSQAPFLQMPPSPMSAGYSPSTCKAEYTMMPPSPQMLHPGAQAPHSPTPAPTNVRAPPTEYYRMPAQGLQLPKGRPVKFTRPLPDPTKQEAPQSVSARVPAHSPPAPPNNGSMSARAPPPLPGNKPAISRSPDQSVNKAAGQSNSRTPSQSPPSTSRPALPMTRPNVNRLSS